MELHQQTSGQVNGCGTAAAKQGARHNLGRRLRLEHPLGRALGSEEAPRCQRGQGRRREGVDKHNARQPRRARLSVFQGHCGGEQTRAHSRTEGASSQANPVEREERTAGGISAAVNE